MSEETPYEVWKRLLGHHPCTIDNDGSHFDPWAELKALYEASADHRESRVLAMVHESMTVLAREVASLQSDRDRSHQGR